ncbi:MAG: hypothetical protein M1832_000518 [Thelocarpon impressellum]|nr:MAG: hypothetical protein M1832_000518 [Thelocarpon impressellum]
MVNFWLAQAAVLALLSAIASAVQPVKVKGSDFVNSVTGARLQIIGVAYQPGGESGYSPGSRKDPLSDAAVCLRDAALMQRLGINAIRVYNLDPSLDHDLCASIFNSVGIYMLLDVNSPLGGESINRGDPGSSYHAGYLNRIFSMVEAFKNYPNTLAFFGGNEVINDDPSAKVIPPYLRAVQRDLKQYIAKHADRPIPVGYSAADVRELLASTWAYLQCAIDGKQDDETRADFFALNTYSWCGSDATFQTSGYDALVAQFSNTSIPVFFSEYGCNKVLPRTFNEVQAIYGPQMTPVLSGGLVYEYAMEANKYGLVKLGGGSDGSAELLEDYDNLQGQYAKLDIKALQTADKTGEASSAPSCEKSLITAPNFNTSFDVPPTPSDAQSLLDDGVPDANKGKLVPVKDTKVSQQVKDSKGAVLADLAIKPLPEDQSNAPDPSVTSSATAAAASATKTGGTGRGAVVGTWSVVSMAVVGALTACL